MQSRRIVTKIMIAINVAIFFLGEIFGLSGLLRSLGALTLPEVLNGEIRRILSAGFLHAGLLHLLANMVSLFYLGRIIEYVYGPKKMILVYIGSLFIASICSLYLSEPLSSSVGASGAIFGLMGALIIVALSPRFPGIQLDNFLIFIIGFNILNSFTPGIDTAGHFGGLVGGLILSYFLIS